MILKGIVLKEQMDTPEKCYPKRLRIVTYSEKGIYVKEIENVISSKPVFIYTEENGCSRRNANLVYFSLRLVRKL